MTAYKGLNGDLTCTLGSGTFQYTRGETVREESSLCASRGMHCTEYPMECFAWYPPGKGNRYFEVEAAGSIDECGLDAKIACTELTLLEELTTAQLVVKGVMYMVEHPSRKWELHGTNTDIKRDRAQAEGKDSVAVARGRCPKVKGTEGSVLGLVCEDENGRIMDAKVFTVKGSIRPGVWYTLKDRQIKEAGR